MAIGDSKYVFQNPHLTLGTTDVSPAVSRVMLSITHPVSETRRAGKTGPDRVVSPIYDWQIDVDFQLDSLYAASEINATIEALMRPPEGSGTGIGAMILRGSSAAVATTNPQWTGNVTVESWTPFGPGQVGEFVVITKTFMGADALAKATS